jgi:hypothetical protein
VSARAAITVAVSAAHWTTIAISARTWLTRRRRHVSFWRSEECFAGEANLSLGIHIENFHFDHVAFLQNVIHIVDSLVRDLGNMKKPILVREHADECTEISDLLDWPLIRLSDF